MKEEYAVVDLELASSEGLTELATLLEQAGMSLQFCDKLEDGAWAASFGPKYSRRKDPEGEILGYLDTIEGFTNTIQETWKNCSARDLDIGYGVHGDGAKYSHTLSAETVRRLGEHGASLTITVMP